MTVTLSDDPARLGSTTVAELRSAIEDLVGDRAKVEILGGEVIVSPLAIGLHDRIVSRLEHMIYDAIGDSAGRACWRPERSARPEERRDVGRARSEGWRLGAAGAA
jgi:hypothetical protein